MNREDSKPLDEELKKMLAKIAGTVRGLAMDAVQKANSGHPGMPMGCAEIGAYLWGVAMRYNPKDPHWANRDRFILSAGHGSMFLYSLLHLSGYNLSIDDIKRFRQLHSITPGHPESRDTEGVETTTGPLGQGVGNAVGQALGFKMLEARFNTSTHQLLNPKIWCIAGDGCMMEGVSSEVSSLAGHLGLNNLILIYDANKITLDGFLAESNSENTKERYKAYGWDVYEMDGHNLDDIHATLSHIQHHQKKPTLVIAHTVIGKGSPNKSGSHKAHGAPLGPEEVTLSKEALGLPLEDFYVADDVYAFFKEKMKEDASKETEWQEQFDSWAKQSPDGLRMWEQMSKRKLPSDLEFQLRALEIKSPIAGRKASNMVINELSKLLPQLIGGSADLSCSDLTMMKDFPLVEPGKFEGRNIKFGVREFGMATMATGLAQTGLFTPFVGTFLTFSDYMRNAIRLCSLMKEHVIYQFTHDLIFLGEDGPTHQPVEHLAALRAIPNLHVIRPGDASEVKGAWIAALRYEGPTALILSRQNLLDIEGTDLAYAEGVGRGAYVIIVEKGKKPDYTLIATGSELSLAVEVAHALGEAGKDVRVLSMPCWEIFEEQPEEYKEEVLGGDIGIRVSIEAAVSMGWSKYIGDKGIAISVDRFGASAPIKDLVQEYGFTVDAIVGRILS